jgi:hypothetical protein
MKKANKMISTLSAAVILAFTSGYSSAESACKGMEKNSCESAGSCRWIKGYERSDGRTVAGYCRKLPGKNGQSASKKKSTQKG